MSILSLTLILTLTPTLTLTLMLLSSGPDDGMAWILDEDMEAELMQLLKEEARDSSPDIYIYI